MIEAMSIAGLRPLWRGACCAVLLAASPVARPDAGNDIQVDVAVEDGVVRVATAYFAEATPREVWAVMTDFEAVPRYSANVRTSVVLARSEATVRIAQAGAATFGPIRFPFDSVRELRLVPERRMESTMVSGSMKSYRGVTELTPEGSGTWVRHRSEAVPNRWIPPVVGPHLIEHETREHIMEVRAEILRRKATAPH